MSSTSLVRSQDERVIAGVCGGIADRFGWRASRVRIAYVLLSILSTGFPGILVYMVLWFLMPEEERMHRGFMS